MDWTNKNIHPSKVVSVGDETEVMVLDIDEDRRRISLGIKQCRPNPWEEFSVSHAKNEKITGNIKSITDFGIFIGLDGGIDGLVHLSDISWNEPGETAVRRYSKGEEVETIILSVDPERERISLGIKQLDQDPFTDYTAVNDRGSIVKGKVIETDVREVVIELAEDVTGIMKASEISLDRVEDARTQHWQSTKKLKSRSSTWIARTAPSACLLRRRMWKKSDKRCVTIRSKRATVPVRLLWAI